MSPAPGDQPGRAAILDAMAEAVFGGEPEGEGRRRLAPMLARFDAQVGAVRVDDADAELLHAIRVDWALCDAWIEGRPGETWAHRAAAGRVPGLVADARWRAFADSVASLFEVWPGEPVLCRDTLGGLVAPLLDPIEGLDPAPGGPAALWELRVVCSRTGVRMCRPPLEYPLSFLPELASVRAGFPAPREQALADLRRARLRWARSGRRRHGFLQ